MNKAVILGAVSAISLQACVMAPVAPMQPMPVMVQQPSIVVQQPSGVVVPPGVVYVPPSYPAPAVGFIWEFHPRFGWGWRHPQHGWHRGWH